MISGLRFRAPKLGPGATYLRPLDQLFREHADLVHVAEIEPQSLWTKPTAPHALPRGSTAELHDLATLPQRILIHGVGSPVAGTLGGEDRHADEYRRWSDKLGSPWTSEHLSILDVPTDDAPQSCGFLMPPLQTVESVALAAANIRRRATTVARPFAFETGVNYFAANPHEMGDGEFFAAIADAADCGILLDLNNLWVNERNGRAKVDAVLAKLPLERIWEIHLAGAEFASGYWVDAHCGGIDPDLVRIAADVIPDLPNLGAIIFEISPQRFPTFGPVAFLKEIETLHHLWAKARPGVGPSTAGGGFSASPVDSQRVTPQEWERQIAFKMLPPTFRGEAVEPAHCPSDEEGFALYAELAASFRHGAITQLLNNSIRLLLMSLGKAYVRDLFDRYTAIASASPFPTDEALGFARFALIEAPAVPGLIDVLKFETAAIEAAADGRIVRVTLPADLDASLHDISAGQIPVPNPASSQIILEVGVVPSPFVRLAGKGENITTDAS